MVHLVFFSFPFFFSKVHSVKIHLMNKVIEMPEGKLDILEMPPKPLLYPHAEPHHTTSQMVKVILMRSHEDIDVRGVYLFGRSKPIDISDHVNF